MKRILLMCFVTFLWTSYAFAQDPTITGTVKSDDGVALPGVNVIVKGTTNGTSSNADGNFSISAPVGSRLVFSFIGYNTQEFVIDKPGATPVVITLITDSRQLSEVVVTGVGVATDKKHLSIAVESISAQNLPATPSASIDQALIGKIPGAQISSISGNPGDPVNIVLRGINTLQNGTKPLILIDGVQMQGTDINSLDLSMVDRIEVVQGAASATLYGAQGANGVIQIFTKKGKQGVIAVNFSSSYASNSFINSGNLHKADLHPYLTDANNNIVDGTGKILTYNEFGAIEGISYTNGGAARYGILNPNNVNNKPYNANLKYYDHFKQIFQTGNTFNNNINISGANEKSDYAISLANNHTLSPILQNGYVDRTNLTANIGTHVIKGLTIRSITQLVYTKNTLKPGLGAPGGKYYGEGNTLGNVGGVYGFLNTSPFFDLNRRLADGTSPSYQVADFLSINARNPVYNKEYTDGLDNKIDVIQGFNGNYKINKFIELDAKYGINYKNENSKWIYYNQSLNTNSINYGSWYGNYNNDGSGVDNTGEIDNFQYTNTFQNFLATTYIRTNFLEDFNIKLPIRTSTQFSFDYRNNKYKEVDVHGNGVSLLPPINLKTSNSPSLDLDYIKQFITYGYLVNQVIDIGDWGGITVGFRSDYSSAFGGGSKPFTFPRASAYILPSSFNFWENKLANFIPYFKLRAAYGEAGIQPGAFDRIPAIDQNNIDSKSVYSIQQVSKNPNIQVETTKELELGTDFTITANKGKWLSAINGSITYWQRSSQGVIFQVGSAPSKGAPNQLNNVIGTKANGTQIGLNLTILRSNDFTWDFTTNFSHQVSKISSIFGGNDVILTSAAGSTALALTEGNKIGQIYGYKALTNFTDTRSDGTRYINEADVNKYTLVDGRVVNKATKGIFFKDQISSLGDPNPKFNVSFINSFSFKKFVTLGFQFDWVYKSHLYNQTREWMYRDGISGDFTKQVTIDGQTGAYTAYWASAYYGLGTTARGSGNNGTKDFFYEDASFVRLRNISLSFDIDKFLKIKYFKKLQLVLTGRNILTKTKYTGMDPEVSSGTANSSFDRGVDNSTMPNIKSYQIGINVGF